MKVKITGEYIKLGQFLKKIKIISSGGQAKIYIENNSISISGNNEIGRGSKIRPGDTVWINDQVYMISSEE